MSVCEADLEDVPPSAAVPSMQWRVEVHTCDTMDELKMNEFVGEYDDIRAAEACAARYITARRDLAVKHREMLPFARDMIGHLFSCQTDEPLGIYENAYTWAVRIRPLRAGVLYKPTWI